MTRDHCRDDEKYQADLVEYLRRSYHAVDGLWFVMVEEELGFDRALDLDQKVWAVLAKIQARKAQELSGAPADSLEALAQCFRLKLEADGHKYDCSITEDELRITIHECAWLELLRKSGREHIAPQVARAICLTEGAAWCRECTLGLEFEIPQMACDGAGQCQMVFRRTACAGAAG